MNPILSSVLGAPNAPITSTAPPPPSLPQQALSGALNFAGLAGVNRLVNPPSVTPASY